MKKKKISFKDDKLSNDDIAAIKRGGERILKILEAFKARDPQNYKFWNYMPIEYFKKLFCEDCVLHNKCTDFDSYYSCYWDAFMREANKHTMSQRRA